MAERSSLTPAGSPGVLLDLNKNPRVLNDLIGFARNIVDSKLDWTRKLQNMRITASMKEEIMYAVSHARGYADIFDWVERDRERAKRIKEQCIVDDSSKHGIVMLLPFLESSRVNHLYLIARESKGMAEKSASRLRS
jgi:hypothetical protein